MVETILWTDKIAPEVYDVGKSLLPSGFTLLTLEERTQECLVNKAKDADYFFLSGNLNINKEVLDAASKLKMIQKSGVGYDHLDLNLLKQRNIPTYRTVNVNTIAVAEHTVMLMLAALRRVTYADSQLRKGNWLKWALRTGNCELNGKTVGLVGLGNIGSEVAKRLAPFNVNILYYKRTQLPQGQEKVLGVTYQPLSELLRMADIISLLLPLTPQTRGLIGRKEIAAMKKGVVFVNTARGPIVDEEALIEALRSGHIRSAGLDVFAEEPVKPGHPLLELDNVVLTPHVASGTIETLTRTIAKVFANISLFAAGKEPPIEERIV